LNRKRTILVVLACDLDEDGMMLGLETVTRCARAAEVYNNLTSRGEKVTVVISAGMADPEHYPSQERSMAEMMRDSLAWSYGVNALDILVFRQEDGSNIWGSRAEIESAVIHRAVLHTLDKIHVEHEPIHVVTSWYHAPRIRLIARAMNTKVKVHTTWGRLSMAVQEIWKIPGEWLRFIFPKFGETIDQLRGRSA
jgi:uncharacterized SAM-binding protein YcdF (DUF218 family)